MSGAKFSGGKKLRNSRSTRFAEVLAYRKVVRCAFEGCPKFGVELACGGSGVDDEPSLRALPLGFYCDTHAAAAAESGDHLPEYFHTCRACGCLQGVN